MRSQTAFVFTTYTLTDPTTRNSIYSISRYFEKVIVVQQNSKARYNPLDLDNVVIEDVEDFEWLPRLFGVKNILKWGFYKWRVNFLIWRNKPDLIITFMLGPLAAIRLKPAQKLISCIYDIPDSENAGLLDSVINKNGFNKLKYAQLVWASDKHKSVLAAQLAGLNIDPLVCYNCPALNYLPLDDECIMKRWLREQLRKDGAEISDSGGTILLRAGAIGVFGGIEETLLAMQSLPKDHLFLMMGRPDKSYGQQIRTLIEKYGLEKRAFLWDRTDDTTWKKAIFGADIGHLVHLPPPSQSSHAGAYALNSSLSNYRLFYYMAAGLPIMSYDDSRLNEMHADVECFRVLKTSSLVQDTINTWLLLNNDPVFRKKLGSNAKNAFLAKYNWENQFSPIEQFIESDINLTAKK